MIKTRVMLSALLLTLGITSASAEIIISADTQTTLKVAEVSSLSFDGDFNTGNLVVNFTDGTTSTTPIASIQQISFQKEESPVVGIKNVATPSTIAVKGNFVFISSNGGEAVIYDAQGRTVQAAALNDGNTTLSLAKLPVGSYIVNINGRSAKFLKK